MCNTQHKHDEIVKWYEELMKDNPDVPILITDIGSSYEERKQYAVHINKGQELKIYFQCQIHASMCMLLIYIHTCYWFILYISQEENLLRMKNGGGMVL